MPPRSAMPAAERRIFSRLRQLLNEPGILRGNLVESHRRCGKKSCRCAVDDEARHRALILCLSLDGKRTSIYVPPDWEGRVREWVARYGEIRDLVEQLSRESLARLKARKE
jgi:Family of unknown function (DUF6788)